MKLAWLLFLDLILWAFPWHVENQLPGPFQQNPIKSQEFPLQINTRGLSFNYFLQNPLISVALTGTGYTLSGNTTEIPNSFHVFSPWSSSHTYYISCPGALPELRLWYLDRQLFSSTASYPRGSLHPSLVASTNGLLMVKPCWLSACTPGTFQGVIAGTEPHFLPSLVQFGALRTSLRLVSRARSCLCRLWTPCATKGVWQQESSLGFVEVQCTHISLFPRAIARTSINY